MDWVKYAERYKLKCWHTVPCITSMRQLGLHKLVGVEYLAIFRLLHEFWFVSDVLSRVIWMLVCFGPSARVNLPFVVDLCFIV